MLSRRLHRLRELSSRNLSVWGLLALEFVAIIAAVAIGFWVNEWREGRDRRQVAEAALRSLSSELQSNHEQLTSTWSYYRTILAEIEARQGDTDDQAVAEGYGYQLPSWRGAMPTLLRSSSFEMLLGTGTIRDLPFEQAENLARIYHVQGVLKQLDHTFMVTIATDPGFTRINAIRHRFSIYTELIPSMLAIYEELAGPILDAHGFTSVIDDPMLREQVEKSRGSLRAANYEK